MVLRLERLQSNEAPSIGRLSGAAPEGSVATFSLEIYRVIVPFVLEPFGDRSVPPSMNHFVCLQQQRLRDLGAEHFRGLEVDHELELGGLFDR